MDTNFQESFEKYFQGCQDVYNEYHTQMGFSESNKNRFDYSVGRRYVKVFYHMGESQRSVHSFVDTKNGDVLKPAGWSKPAKHARGNIFDEKNGLGMMGPHGPAYLR